MQNNMSDHIEVIAEIGKNFVTTQEEEPLDVLLFRAKQLILSAKQCGADVAKFQVHNVTDEIHPNAQIISPHFDHDRYAWVKRNTYPVEFWWQIKEYCREVGIEFLATPMSRGAAEILDDVGVDRWKIGSGDILDFVMLDYVRDTGKPVILSSGMSTIQELRKAYDYVHEKTNEVAILHCVSCYPCPLESLNLNTIPFLKKQFPEAKIGFSDHSLGIDGSLMAVTLGAEVIEKHFTFDRNSWGPDHKVSLLPEEMKKLTRTIFYYNQDRRRREINEMGYIVEEGKDGIRLRKREPNEPLQPITLLPSPTPEALGVETKFIQEDEVKFRKVFRKGLYVARDIREGQIFEPDMIYAMRPSPEGGIASESYPSVVGRVATRSFKKYESIT